MAKAIGVDLGGTNLRLALVDINHDHAEVVDEKRLKLETKEPRELAKQLCKIIEEMPNVPDDAPLGIGVAGMLDPQTGVVKHGPNLGWKDVPILQLIQAVTGRPVAIENDVNAIAWGEFRFGAGRECANIVCVFMGTGVGGGAVLDGKVYHGGSGVALEVGHVRVVPDGKQCLCGAKGCLEAYAGGAHLAELAREAATEKLRSQVDGKLDALHAGHIDAAARDGDEVCQQIILQAAAYTAGVLGDVAVLLNPDAIVLGGTVWQGCPYLRDVMLHVFASLDASPARDYVKLLQAELPETAGMLGAADLALDFAAEAG